MGEADEFKEEKEGQIEGDGGWNAPVTGVCLLLQTGEEMEMQGWKLLCHSELGSA